MLIFLISIQRVRPANRLAWIVAIAVATINSTYLGVSVLGLLT